MSQEEITALIKSIGAEEASQQEARNNWRGEFDLVLKREITKIGEPAYPDDPAYAEAIRAAFERANESMPPIPRHYDEIYPLQNALGQKIKSMVYRGGKGALPDLYELSKQYELSEGTLRAIVEGADIGLNGRFDFGMASFPQSVAAIDEMGEKGYLQFADHGNIDGKITPAGIEQHKREYMQNILANEFFRRRVIEELQAIPPTKNSIEIANLFLEYPDIIKNIPDLYLSPIAGTKESWMETAAKLSPQTALEMKDKLIENGFGDAVESVEKAQHSSLIQYDPITQHVEAQILPDARSNVKSSIIRT